jgi:hypothetical protein
LSSFVTVACFDALNSADDQIEAKKWISALKLNGECFGWALKDAVAGRR